MPKYRRMELYNQQRKDSKEIIKTLCENKEVEIIKGHMMSDHVHLLLSISPKNSIIRIVFENSGKVAVVAVTDACRNTADWKIRPHQLLSKKHKYLKKGRRKTACLNS